MLEFNHWFFVLLANFLVLLFVLNKILFQPLLGTFKEREASTKGFMDNARTMEAEKESAIAGMRSRFAEAGKQARKEFEALKSEGLDNQRAQMAEAAKQAAATIERARAEIESDAAKARQALQGEVVKLSAEISLKVAGV